MQIDAFQHMQHFVQAMQQKAQHAIAAEDQQQKQELHKLMARSTHTHTHRLHPYTPMYTQSFTAHVISKLSLLFTHSSFSVLFFYLLNTHPWWSERRNDRWCWFFKAPLSPRNWARVAVCPKFHMFFLCLCGFLLGFLLSSYLPESHQ